MYIILCLESVKCEVVAPRPSVDAQIGTTVADIKGNKDFLLSNDKQVIPIQGVTKSLG